MSEERQEQNEKVVVVQKMIYLSLRRDIEDVVVNICNFYKAIRVTNSNLKLNMWIRIYTLENNELILDFSSVELPKELRRKGIFTNLFERLKNAPSVKCIRVSSVLTEEMRNWCTKNNFTKMVYLEDTYQYVKEDN